MLDFRTFTEKVQLFSISKTEGTYGKQVTTYTDLGYFPASVNVMSGSKALYYQEKGFGHPVSIRMRFIPEEIGKIIWDGKTIYPRSIIRQNEKSTTRGNYLVIEGGYKNDEG